MSKKNNKGKGRGGWNKRTHDSFVAKAKAVHKDRFLYLEEYKGSQIPIKIRCTKCGHTFKRRPQIIYRSKTGCAKCSKKYQDPENYARLVKEIHKGEITLLTPYKKAREKIKLKHTCGHVWETMASNLTVAKSGCPQCKRRKLPHKKLLDLVEQKYGKEYEILSVYSPQNRRLTIKHKTCNTTFTRGYDNFLYGDGTCPTCFVRGHKTENTFYDLLRAELGADIRIYRNLHPSWLMNPKTKKPLELDIFIPDLHLAFEIQGWQHYHEVPHWGGEAAFKKLQERDALKAKRCAERNINLIHFDNRIMKTTNLKKRKRIMRSFIKEVLANYEIALLWCGVTKPKNYTPSPVTGSEREEPYWEEVIPEFLKKL